MKVTFFNSAFVSAPARPIGASGGGRMDLRVRFAIVEHPKEGPVLIDGGYGREIFGGKTWALRGYAGYLDPSLRLTPEEALRHLGYEIGDVRRVLLSHLHADHVCGLGGLPGAELIMSDASAALLSQSRRRDSLRHGIFAELVSGLSPFVRTTSSMPQLWIAGLGWTYDIFGDASVFGVKLDGHARGQLGFLFPDVGTGLLYAVDTAWTMEALRSGQASRFPASLVAASRPLEAQSIDLVSGWEVNGGQVVLCHDPELTEFDWEGRA